MGKNRKPPRPGRARRHSWAMLAFVELTDDEAEAIASGAASTAVDVPPTFDGPGCLDCHQAYAVAAGLPCPGRPWTDTEALQRQSISAMERQRRRDMQRDRSRAIRKGHAKVEVDRFAPLDVQFQTLRDQYVVESSGRLKSKKRKRQAGHNGRVTTPPLDLERFPTDASKLPPLSPTFSGPGDPGFVMPEGFEERGISW